MDNEALPEQHLNELPQPVATGAPAERVPGGAEKLPNAEVMTGSSSAPSRPSQPMALPSLPPTHTTVPPVPAQNPPHVTPVLADDTDLIEKAWVDKAKTIVAQTRHDPHEQKKQISVLKADYMKKRYNKDLKTS